MVESVICKTFKDKERMRSAGRSAATVLDRLCAMVAPGISTWDLDEAGGEIMKDLGVKVHVRDIAQVIVFSHLTPVCRSMRKWFTELV